MTPMWERDIRKKETKRNPLIFLRKMLWDVFRVLGNNLFKRNFYEAKKKIF